MPAEPRTPPTILRIPPRYFSAHTCITMALISIVPFAVVGFYIIFSEVLRGPATCRLANPELRTGLYCVAVGVGFGIFVGAMLLWYRRRINWHRRVFLQHGPVDDHDPLIFALQRARRDSQGMPLADRVAKILETHLETDRSGAIIVCYGLVRFGRPGSHLFEPEIIAPIRSVPAFLVDTGVIALFAIFWGAVLMLASFARSRDGLTVSVIFLSLGLLMLLVHLLPMLLHPVYIRIAPGIVQFMSYPLGRRGPVIRAYPLERGTAVVVANGLRGGPNQTVFSFARDGRSNRFSVPCGSQPDSLHDHVWQAILWPGSIPPLSDEQLVG